MEKRYQKFVLEAEEGISFVVLEGNENELIIKAVKQEKEKDFSNDLPQITKEKNIKKNEVLDNLPENVPKEIVKEEQEEQEVQEDLSQTVRNKEEKQEVVKEEQKEESKISESILETVKEEVKQDDNSEDEEKTSQVIEEKEELYEDYSDNYNKPPIPEGFEYVEGAWNDGYVIRRIEDKSEFVWVPVGSLEANGTFDGETFDQKFGRRNYKKDVFSDEQYNEKLEGELLKQLQSVRKYGGFYISRYNISKNDDGKMVSIKDAMPYVNVSYDNALKLAAAMINTDDVSSHLVYGAEYDSVLEWIISSKAKSFNDVVNISNEWGNFFNSKNSTRVLAKTGCNEDWCVYRIYDFAGNVRELTQEKFEKSYCVMRGGGFNNISSAVANRQKNYHTLYYRDAGFRVILYIK